MAEHNILYTAIEFQDDSPIPGNETTSVDNKENHPKNQIERYKNINYRLSCDCYKEFLSLYHPG